MKIYVITNGNDDNILIISFKSLRYKYVGKKSYVNISLQI